MSPHKTAAYVGKVELNHESGVKPWRRYNGPVGFRSRQQRVGDNYCSDGAYTAEIEYLWR